VNEREILSQRIVTLSGLLDTPGGALGPAAGELGARLRAGWETERRLLERIVAEAKDGDVRTVVDVWHARTTAFLGGAGGDAAGWTDGEGRRWLAAEVLALLDDVRERLATWAVDVPGESEAV